MGTAALVSPAGERVSAADTPEQAANLRARAELMRQIAVIVNENGWTQAEAAGQCGVTHPRMNDLLRGCVSRFSIDALVNIATAIGRSVSFDLRAAKETSRADLSDSRLLRPTVISSHRLTLFEGDQSPVSRSRLG